MTQWVHRLHCVNITGTQTVSITRIEAVVHNRIAIKITDRDISVSTLALFLAILGAIRTIVFVGEANRVTEFVNRYGLYAVLSVLFVSTFCTPTFKRKVENHTVSHAVNFTTEPFCVGAGIADADANVRANHVFAVGPLGET